MNVCLNWFSSGFDWCHRVLAIATVASFDYEQLQSRGAD